MRKPSIPRAQRIVAVAGACLVLAGAACAAPITYTLSGTASGRLGATDFSDAAFVVTASADTATVNSLGPGIPCNDPGRATVTIRGVGSGSITTPLSVAANGGWQLLAFAHGRCTDAGSMWTNGRSPQLDGYDLARPIGPVPLAMPSAPPGIVVDTTAGALAFAKVTGLNFEAQAGAPAAIPTLGEAGLLLLSLVLAGTGAMMAKPPRGAAAGPGSVRLDRAQRARRAGAVELEERAAARDRSV